MSVLVPRASKTSLGLDTAFILLWKKYIMTTLPSCASCGPVKQDGFQKLARAACSRMRVPSLTSHSVTSPLSRALCWSVTTKPSSHTRGSPTTTSAGPDGPSSKRIEKAGARAHRGGQPRCTSSGRRWRCPEQLCCPKSAAQKAWPALLVPASVWQRVPVPSPCGAGRPLGSTPESPC